VSAINQTRHKSDLTSYDQQIFRHGWLAGFLPLKVAGSLLKSDLILSLPAVTGAVQYLIRPI
jgi:hypothetical protein